MSPVTNPLPHGHRPGASSSGNSASAASELVSPYSNNADGEFNNYVNMSPTTAPAVPREPYGAQLGLYVPAQVDPSLNSNSGTTGATATTTTASGTTASSSQSTLSYAHVNGGGRTASNSDLRVAYERPSSGSQYPQA